MSGRCSLTRSLRLPGRGFLARTRFSTFTHDDATPPLGATQRNVLWRMRRNWQPNSPETLLALGYYQYWVLRDYGAAKTTFERVSKMLPGSSEVPYALGRVARREGHWDESIAYFEQALALDPRNVELLYERGMDLRACFDNSRPR